MSSSASPRSGTLCRTPTRSADDLPEEVTAAIRRTLVPDLEPATLTAALADGTMALLVELQHVAERLADRLAPLLRG
jgi:hypothetical protein